MSDNPSNDPIVDPHELATVLRALGFTDEEITEATTGITSGPERPVSD